MRRIALSLFIICMGVGLLVAIDPSLREFDQKELIPYQNMTFTDPQLVAGLMKNNVVLTQPASGIFIICLVGGLLMITLTSNLSLATKEVDE